MPGTFLTSTPAEASLFNPAFIGLLVASASNGYKNVTGSGIPFELALLVPPIALHEATRLALPGNTSGRMSSWALANPVVTSEFPSRARAMTPLAQEGIRYAMRSAALILDGGLLVSRLPRRIEKSLHTADARDCLRASGFAGRWFAHTGDSRTIFALLGVRP
jgi:hypothetical protein